MQITTNNNKTTEQPLWFLFGLFSFGATYVAVIIGTGFACHSCYIFSARILVSENHLSSHVTILVAGKVINSSDCAWFCFVSHKFQMRGRVSRVEHQTKADQNRQGKWDIDQKIIEDRKAVECAHSWHWAVRLVAV